MLLIFISEKITMPISKISDITLSKIEENVKIHGEIESLTQSKDTSFLTTKDDTGKINVVVFEPGNINLQKGDLVEIEGKVALYNNKLEVIAKTIKVV